MRFIQAPDAPPSCALEIIRALKELSVSTEQIASENLARDLVKGIIPAIGNDDGRSFRERIKIVRYFAAEEVSGI